MLASRLRPLEKRNKTMPEAKTRRAHRVMRKRAKRRGDLFFRAEKNGTGGSSFSNIGATFGTSSCPKEDLRGREGGVTTLLISSIKKRNKEK